MAKHESKDIYKNDKWKRVMHPADIGRTDWHHNPQGQVDYLPNVHNKCEIDDRIPLEKQKYNVEYEEQCERGTSNLIAARERKPDWNEYERIIREFN